MPHVEHRWGFLPCRVTALLCHTCDSSTCEGRYPGFVLPARAGIQADVKTEFCEWFFSVALQTRIDNRFQHRKVVGFDELQRLTVHVGQSGQQRVHLMSNLTVLH